MIISDIKGKKISVIGAARSGVAVSVLLNSYGAKVFVSDSGDAEKLSININNIKAAGIEYELGKHSDRIYNADLIVLSPGVPKYSTVVQNAIRRGIKILSELEIASLFCPAPIVAITGTNGKTTTTALTAQMFIDDHRKCIVGGNIGTAFSSILSELDASYVAVLEVSSFQLDFIESFHPKVSVILNITPDHLDRYNGSFEQYALAKCRIFQNQKEGDFLVYCDDSETTREKIKLKRIKGVRLFPFGIYRQYDEGAYVKNGYLVTKINGKESIIIKTEEIRIKGIHNLYNAMAATLCSQVFGLNVASIKETLISFKGVEHRLEFVRELNGVKYINDSKATNVDSVWHALQAIPEPIVLLLGGRDKGNDYSKLFDSVRKKVKAIIAIGESADKVMSVFNQFCKIFKALSMEEAVHQANKIASSGEVVLLSPACASFDWYTNYEHRGNDFKQIVNSL